MNTIRPCGCKGVRTCLQCEEEFGIRKTSLKQELQRLEAYSYCVACRRLCKGWDVWRVRQEHPHHEDSKEVALELPGVLVVEDFLGASEAQQLMVELDALPWTVSQSGRRKQNYGPKTNFKKRKLQNGLFKGFPACSEFIQQRFAHVELLRDFQSIEQCTLEYDPGKGASIDPHIDDCWIWGERVVTVNCLGDSVLTLVLYEQGAGKYNLSLLPVYEDQLLLPLAEEGDLEHFKQRVIRIPMPNYSLIVLYGPARYQFEHCVLREDVQERRVCIAYREFTPMYINGEESDKGHLVTQNAQQFWPHLKDEGDNNVTHTSG